ncbi:MAG: HEAT repeat domain-containing protein [Acidobacteria bacterium]|nr:HEAT repeat domain-containing protein [Acidobacteriota bacterium]
MRGARLAATVTTGGTRWSPRRALARALAAGLAAVVATACATAPPPVVAPPPPTFEQKMAAILHLEDRRTLTDAALTPPSVGALPTLLTDSEGRVRRRAALAIGRSGVAEGVVPLTTALAKDVEPEVRAMAAFALGLMGDAAAAPALLPALGDPDPRVQGRAAEALGLINHAAAAGSIAGMAAAHVKAGALAGIASDDETHPLSPTVEAVRLGVYALARLGAVDELRAVLIGGDGSPVSDWWPLAYAMQSVGKPAALPTLRLWLTRGGSTTRAFVARGLGTLKDADSRVALEALVKDDRQTTGVRVQAMRALAAIGDRRSAAVLTPLADKAPSVALRLEAVAALGAVADPAAAELLVDYLEAEGAPLRAAAQAALAKADPDTFMTVLSGLDVDKDWSVRAALATTLKGLPPEIAALRLDQLARDADPKVRAAALTSLAALKVPGTDVRLVSELAHADPVVRMAAARGLATLKPAGAAPALARAYEASAPDTTYVARAAMLAALVAVDPAAAAPVLRSALADREWALRVRAATLLRELDAASMAVAARPAPAPAESALDDTAAMIAPAFSPQAYLQTTRGEVRIELAVLDAPRTVANFVALAGRGFFDGMAWHRIVPDFVAQVGDPRGDGEGGPGYTIRDELNQRPYLRGSVGMALDWRDTGGSQFFITRSPQPHLDARYTVFGHVVAGMDVVDRLEPWDRITSVRVWDGTRWLGAGATR